MKSLVLLCSQKPLVRRGLSHFIVPQDHLVLTIFVVSVTQLTKIVPLANFILVLNLVIFD